MEKEDKMNLLFSINKKCISLLQTSMWSIWKNGGDVEYHVYVFHTDLGEKEKHHIRESMPKEIEWNFIFVPEELFADFVTTKRYPKEIYYRLAAPYLLPESVDRILYMDVDTIVINSLMDLYKMDFEGNYFMGCTNTQLVLQKFNQVRLGVDVEKNVPYINTGVLMMNLPLLRENLRFDDICEFSEKKKQMLILPDQDILTALYGEHVKLIDNLRYNLSDRTLLAYNADPRNKDIIDEEWVRKNTSIIHYFGRNKPWKKKYVGILDVFYDEIENEYAEYWFQKGKTVESVVGGPM